MTDVARFIGGPFDGETRGCKAWPPPESMKIVNGVWAGGMYVRIRMSTLTDEQMVGIIHVARGVEYEWQNVE